MNNRADTGEIIISRPIPPEEDFDRFVVGSALPEARNKILRLVQDISGDGRSRSTSQVIVVTGKNGNGKTLLNNMVKFELGRINEPSETPQGNRANYEF